MKKIVLDAGALIAYMRGEQGALIVERHLKDPDTRVLIHAITLYEVYYDAYRQQPMLAYLVWDFVKKFNIRVHERLDKKVLEEGAVFKTSFSMSLADSIALAFASQNKAPLLSTDHHEFEAISRQKLASVKFIR
jgi:predicted nucleic acid-binding protein